MQVQDELLDLVNKQDEVIGTLPRSEVYAKKMHNFRVINGFLINSKRQLWIPKRTAHKRTSPSALDMSFAGHVETRETYEQAFKRELKEELNLDLDKVQFKEIGYFTPHQNQMYAFMKVYEIKFEGVPDFNRNDFVEGHWLYPEEILKQIENGEKAKSDLKKLIKLCYLKEKQ